jgi:hypothetical protein
MADRIPQYTTQLAKVLRDRTGLSWEPYPTDAGYGYRCVASRGQREQLLTRLGGFFAPFVEAGEPSESGLSVLTLNASNATSCMQEYAGKTFRINAAREESYAQARG